MEREDRALRRPPRGGVAACPPGVQIGPARCTGTRQADMARMRVPRYLPALDVHSLDDEKLHELRGAVELAAKTSPLVLASPALQATIAAIVAADDALSV